MKITDPGNVCGGRSWGYASDRRKKKGEQYVKSDSLWQSSRLSTFYNADMSTRLAPFACIDIFGKVTFHLSAESVSHGYEIGDSM